MHFGATGLYNPALVNTIDLPKAKRTVLPFDTSDGEYIAQLLVNPKDARMVACIRASWQVCSEGPLVHVFLYDDCL